MRVLFLPLTHVRIVTFMATQSASKIVVGALCVRSDKSVGSLLSIMYNFADPIAVASALFSSAVSSFSAVSYPNLCCFRADLCGSLAAEIDRRVIFLNEDLRILETGKTDEGEAPRFFCDKVSQDL